MSGETHPFDLFWEARFSRTRFAPGRRCPFIPRFLPKDRNTKALLTQGLWNNVPSWVKLMIQLYFAATLHVESLSKIYRSSYPFFMNHLLCADLKEINGWLIFSLSPYLSIRFSSDFLCHSLSVHTPICLFMHILPNPKMNWRWFKEGHKIQHCTINYE